MCAIYTHFINANSRSRAVCSAHTVAQGPARADCHVEAVAPAVQARQVLRAHHKAEVVSARGIQAHRCGAQDVSRGPHCAQCSTCGSHGVLGWRTEPNCQEGRGRVLFVGVAPESNPAVVGVRATGQRRHGRQGGCRGLRHSRERVQQKKQGTSAGPNCEKGGRAQDSRGGGIKKNKNKTGTYMTVTIANCGRNVASRRSPLVSVSGANPNINK
jgi:hypothetical protein